MNVEKLSSADNDDQLRYEKRKKAWTGKQLGKLLFAAFLLLMICYLIIKYTLASINYHRRLIEMEELKEKVKESNDRMRGATAETEAKLEETRRQKIEVEQLEEKIALRETDIDEFNQDIESLKKQKTSYDSRYEDLVNELNWAKEKNERLKGGEPASPSISISNSKILTTEGERKTIESWTNKRLASICYQAHNESINIAKLFEQCKYAIPTLVLYKGAEGITVGGYTTVPWNLSGEKADREAFIFSLTSKKYFRVQDKAHAVTSGANYISFGDDIIIGNNFCLGKFPFSYGDKYHDSRKELFGNSEWLTFVSFEVIMLE